jgi:hypothetical protein
MAYMSQEKKKLLAPAIKAILKEYGMKGSIAVRHYSSLVVNLREGPIDFGGTDIQVNPYWVHEHYEGKAREFLMKLIKAMNVGNHDNSDIMTDYFDVGWYVEVNVGRYDKPYKVTA